MRIGLLTGGGDCPGLNAAIRAVVKQGTGEYGHTIVGFRNGWKGAAEGDVVSLSRDNTRNLLQQGGTTLGTARFHPSTKNDSMAAVLATVESENLDGVICIGGDGTLSAAAKVAQAGVNVIGIPKTIDNDVVETDLSIGFHTAVNIATEAIDRLHTTAESHNRVMVVEVMGRRNGWIAVTSGIAGGAEVVLAPEEPYDIAAVARFLKHRHRAHASFSIVVVAEGAVPIEGDDALTASGKIIAGSAGGLVSARIAELTGFETRLTVLGHVQRGGTPTPTDRILGSRFGVAAVDAITKGESAVMTAVHGEHVELVELLRVAGRRKMVPEELLRVARALA